MRTFLPTLTGSSIFQPVFSDLFSKFEELDDSPGTWAEGSVGFRMDVLEHADRYVISADLPGTSTEQVEITLNNSRLSIEVQPRAEAHNSNGEARYVLRERKNGTMIRNVFLPYVTSDKNVDACLRDGVLTVTIKKNEDSMPKKIKIQP